MIYKHFIGVDISKEWFDVAEHAKKQKSRRFNNNKRGFNAFTKRFASVLPEALVVLEATGGYETALIAHLINNKVAVHRAHPLTAKQFIRSIRPRAKTDTLDAIALARYAAERHGELALFSLGDKIHIELERLLARKNDLITIRTMEKSRQKHPRYTTLKYSLSAVIEVLNNQITSLDQRIEAIIMQSDELKGKMEVLTSLKGVGKQTALTLLVSMPELGTLTGKQAASLAGCAPQQCDSGKTFGYRKTGRGRVMVKKALYMAAMCAIRLEPNLRDFYQRLKKNGKKPLVALVAIMRKTIVILNARIRDYIETQTTRLYCKTL